MLYHVDRTTLVSRIAAARRIPIGAVGDVGRRITPSARRTSVSTSRALLTTGTVTASAPRRNACGAGNLRVSLRSHARTVSTLGLTSVAATAGARTTHWRLMAWSVAGHGVRRGSGLGTSLGCHRTAVLREAVGWLGLAVARGLGLLRGVLRLVELPGWRTVFAPLEIC